MTTSEIEELLAKASAGPWTVAGYSPLFIKTPANEYVAKFSDIANTAHNAALIVAAVNMLPSLLADRKALLEAVEEIAAMAADEGNLNWGHAQDAIDIARAARDGVAR